jgi:hypothetical protein
MQWLELAERNGLGGTEGLAEILMRVQSARISLRNHRLESRMREIRPSGLEGGVARKRHPYPYLPGASEILCEWCQRPGSGLQLANSDALPNFIPSRYG